MSWNPDEWQSRCMLLASKYHRGASGFQEIPDSHGDCGLEGFTTDGSGIGYQCYVPEEAAESPLTERLIQKINNDTLKLKKYQNELTKILGPVKLKRWNLLIPKEYFRDQEVIQHAVGKRTELVTSWKLPFVDDDFRIVVSYGAEFEDLAESLKTLGMKRIELDGASIEPIAADAWESANAEHLGTLDGKLGRTKRSLPARKIVRTELIKCAVIAQNSLNRIRNDDPESWETIIRSKTEKAESLKMESALTSQVPAQYLQSVMDDYRANLAEKVPSLSDEAARILANEAVVEWLMACPLDFFPENENES
jgi:hypothetical protein